MKTRVCLKYFLHDVNSIDQITKKSEEHSDQCYIEQW